MPYELLEKKYGRLDAAQQKVVGMFVDFLLMHPDGTTSIVSGLTGLPPDEKSSNSEKPCQFRGRKLGGYEKGFYMADDFDAPIPQYPVQTLW